MRASQGADASRDQPQTDGRGYEPRGKWSGRAVGCGGGRRDPFPTSGGGSQPPGWSPAATEQRTRAAWSSRPPPHPTARRDTAPASELRRSPASEEAEELAALGQTPTADGSVPSHLLEKSKDLPRPEIEAPV